MMVSMTAYQFGFCSNGEIWMMYYSKGDWYSA